MFNNKIQKNADKSRLHRGRRGRLEHLQQLPGLLRLCMHPPDLLLQLTASQQRGKVSIYEAESKFTTPALQCLTVHRETSSENDACSSFSCSVNEGETNKTDRP